MSPPVYSDLGKQARDVFGKGYHFGVLKLECKTKSEGGVEVTAGGTHAPDTGKVAGNLETKYKFKEQGLKSSMSTSLKRKKTQYQDDRMEKAIRLILDEKVSVSEVSKRFSIPRSTLRTRLRSNDPLVVKKPGMATALTQDEEGEICDWMIRMSKMGHPKAWKTLALAVKDVLDKMGRRNVFKNNNTPTSGWLQAFKRRHPIIKNIKTREGGISKSKATKEDVRAWFKGLRENLAKENLDPHVFMQPMNGARVFYAEEMRILLQGEDRLSKVLVRKESSGSRKMISAMACMNAAGGFLKPLLVFNGKRPPMYHEHPDLLTSSFDVGFSPTGRMEENVFFYWMQLFVHQLREMPIQKPVLLLLYYNTADVTIATLEMAKDAGIILHMLPPRSSHILQPMDGACFRPLKEAFRESVDFYAPRYGPSINVKQYPLVFMRAWHRATKRDDVITAFHGAGLVPLDENTVITKRMLQTPHSRPKQLQQQQHVQHQLQHQPAHPVQQQQQSGITHMHMGHHYMAAAPPSQQPQSEGAALHVQYHSQPPPATAAPHDLCAADFNRFASHGQNNVVQQQEAPPPPPPPPTHAHCPPPQQQAPPTQQKCSGDVVEAPQGNEQPLSCTKDFVSGLEAALNFVVQHFVPDMVRPIYAEWLAEGKSCTPDPMFYVWRGLQDLINRTKERQQQSLLHRQQQQRALLELPNGSMNSFVESTPLEQNYEGCTQDFQSSANH